MTAAVSAGLVLALPAGGAQAAMPRPGATYPVTFTVPRRRLREMAGGMAVLR